jgi:cytochrome P450
MTENKSALRKWLSKTIRYYLDNNPDAMFAFFRMFKANISLGSIGFITRFSDVQEALMRPDVFRVTYAPMMDLAVGPFMLARDNTTINQRDKGIMLTILSRDDLPKVKACVSNIASRVLDEVKDKKQIELVSEFSRVCPAIFTAEYFGFKGAAVEKLQQWSMATQMDMFHNPFNDRAIHQANIVAGKQMREFLIDLLKQKRQHLATGAKAEDVFDELLLTHFADEIGFDDERILSNMMGLLVGGIETTAQAVTQILNELFKRPKILALAVSAAKASDDELLFNICWEALRFKPINTVVIRRVSSDYTIAKGRWRRHTFKAGTKVLIATGSAMKDPEQLPCPKEFLLDRPSYHYMHTGYGLHTCLGDQINKVQIPEMLKALLLLANLRQGSTMEIGAGGFPMKMDIIFD